MAPSPPGGTHSPEKENEERRSVVKQFGRSKQTLVEETGKNGLQFTSTRKY